MGEFEATFPTDRLYAKNHMWALAMPAEGDSQAGNPVRQWRFGLSAYAVRLLQDVYFLDWEIQPPSKIGKGQMIGSIESKKAESDLYAPLAGMLTAINEDCLADPAAINADPYGRGWMIQIDSDNLESQCLLSPQQYHEHLEAAWEVAQRTIKGQANG